MAIVEHRRQYLAGRQRELLKSNAMKVTKRMGMSQPSRNPLNPAPDSQVEVEKITKARQNRRDEILEVDKRRQAEMTRQQEGVEERRQAQQNRIECEYSFVAN